MREIKMLFSVGKVGSVGDTLPQIRLRQSAPDLEMRFDDTFMKRGGSKITLEGRVKDKDLKNKNYRGYHGFVMQDLVPPDTEVEPYVSSLGDYSWRQKVATVLKAKRTGENFLPLPGGYQGNGVPRGSALPSSVTLNPIELNLVGPVENGEFDNRQEFVAGPAGFFNPNNLGLGYRRGK